MDLKFKLIQYNEYKKQVYSQIDFAKNKSYLIELLDNQVKNYDKPEKKNFFIFIRLKLAENNFNDIKDKFYKIEVTLDRILGLIRHIKEFPTFLFLRNNIIESNKLYAYSKVSNKTEDALQNALIGLIIGTDKFHSELKTDEIKKVYFSFVNFWIKKQLEQDRDNTIHESIENYKNTLKIESNPEIRYMIKQELERKFKINIDI